MKLGKDRQSSPRVNPNIAHLANSNGEARVFINVVSHPDPTLKEGKGVW